jgi:hypothetical protein
MKAEELKGGFSLKPPGTSRKRFSAFCWWSVD